MGGKELRIRQPIRRSVRNRPPGRFWRRGRPRPRRKRFRRGRWALALLLALAAAVCWRGYENLRALTAVYGENRCRALVTQAMLEAAAECRGENLSRRESQGDQTWMTLDSDAVRQYQAAVGRRLKEKLEALQAESQPVALGTVLDSAFFMDRGPKINLRFVPVGSAEIRLDSCLESAGINQVLYRVNMELSVTMTVLLPGGTRTVECVQQVVLEETLITGTVPPVYAGGGLAG